ncbi:hypothetical protein [Streptomyces sp. NPDC051211]|uniref:hypothetical protein n=1 Tax=Streptomyces sp. NPDC051211 TaxID=3154643 RepID=UPI00344D8444
MATTLGPIGIPRNTGRGPGLSGEAFDDPGPAADGADDVGAGAGGDHSAPPVP